MKIRIDPDALAARYIELLEKDLKLERARLETARKDLEFYRGKCERLELAIMNATPAVAGQDYVRRTEPKKPSIGAVKIEGAMRPMFNELRNKWNKMSLEEQDKAVKDGWTLEDERAKEG